LALWRLFTIFLVVLALLFGTKPAYYLAYLAVALFFLFFHVQKKAAAKISVKRLEAASYAFCGESWQIGLEVTNNSCLPLAFVSGRDKIHTNLTAERPKKWVLALPPRSVARVSTPLSARARGIYFLGPLEIFVGDFLGLTTRRFQSLTPHKVVVYPQIRELAELNLPSRLTGGSFDDEKRIYPDASRLAGVRPYQAGDPLRNLHWPATARTNSLQVKQFEHTVAVEAYVLLDFYEPNYKTAAQSELAVTTAASLAAYLIKEGASVGFAANGRFKDYPDGPEPDLNRRGNVLHIPAGEGTAQLRGILTVLAGIEVQAALDFRAFLDAEVPLKRHTLLFLVVSADTPKLRRAAAGLAARGLTVQVFTTAESAGEPGLCRHSGVSFFPVRSGEGLQ